MRHIFDKIPFFRLLIPVVIGILIADYLQPNPYAIAWWLPAILFLVSAYLFRFRFQWLFGLGLSLFLIAFSITAYTFRAESIRGNFPEHKTRYRAVVQDIPQKKARSIACVVLVKQPIKKKIMVYFEPEKPAEQLSAGDEILFFGTPQPFKNLGNPDDFDYARYMKIKGFSASVYLPKTQWKPTQQKKHTLYTRAMETRAHILRFYKSFGLSPDEHAFLSAITLGYKADLSDDVKEAFRVSGTSHVLAVSGLHVGIIFLVIQSLLFFLGKSGKTHIAKQFIIIFFLWVYVFLTGFPVSVIRAAIMLTIYCLSIVNHRRGFTYNTLAAAAFILLVYNPFYLFDVGFQLSFAAVFAILFFQPRFRKWLHPKSKFEKYTWDLFTVSLAAQIGVFPLGLYYFGTFPTYFFMTNVLVVPLIGFNIYATLGTGSITLLAPFGSAFEALFTVSRWLLKFLINAVLYIVYFFESLPFSHIKNVHITLWQTVLIFMFSLSTTFFVKQGKAKPLIVSLAALFLFLVLSTVSFVNPTQNQLIVYNRYRTSEIGYLIHDKKTMFEPSGNAIVPHTSKRIVRLSRNDYRQKKSEKQFKTDVLILSKDNRFSMHDLNPLFAPKIVVLDSSLPRFAAKRLTKECQNRNIKVHDVVDKGAYSVFF